VHVMPCIHAGVMTMDLYVMIVTCGEDGALCETAHRAALGSMQ